MSSFEAPKPVSNPKKVNVANNKDKTLLKLLLMGGVCATAPNPSACLGGLSDDSTSYGSTSSGSYGGASSGYDSGDSQCSNDSQCGFSERCVKRSGKGMCVELVDERGRTVKDRNAELAQCRRNSDCPRNFECDTSLNICVAE